MFEYVPKAEYAPVKRQLEGILRKVQKIMETEYELTFYYELIGSGRRHLITRVKGGNKGFDFDYNLVIPHPGQGYKYKPDVIKHDFTEAFKKALKGTQYSFPKDSTSAITIKMVDKSSKYGRQNSTAERWNSPEQLIKWRAAWADAINQALRERGFEDFVDHRSFKDRGIPYQPTVHEGIIAIAIEKRGIVSVRCEYNRQIDSLWDEIEKNTLGLLENKFASEEENKESLISYLKSLYGMKEATIGSKTSIGGLIDSMDGVLGIERSMNQAVRFVKEDLTTYQNITDRMCGSIDKILEKSRFVVGTIDFPEESHAVAEET